MKNLIILSFLTFSLSNCINVTDDYEKYQTFDEYTLQGVNNSRDIKRPFVAIKRRPDTISVLVYPNTIAKKTKMIQYVNRGNYWYNISKVQLEYRPNCRCDTTPVYIEKFIFHDTIMIYRYSYNDNNKIPSDNLMFKTKTEEIGLANKDGYRYDAKSKFHQLRHYIAKYKVDYPPYEASSQYQSRYYHRYTKKILKDTLFFYEGAGNRMCKKNTLIEQKIMNRLGEFGLDLDL